MTKILNKLRNSTSIDMKTLAHSRTLLKEILGQSKTDRKYRKNAWYGYYYFLGTFTSDGNSGIH